MSKCLKCKHLDVCKCSNEVSTVCLQVNKTFQDLGILQDLNEAWMEVGPAIRDYMETGVQVRLLQV